MDTQITQPQLINLVMKIVDDEPEGDHYLSHLIMAQKVLRMPAGEAIRIGRSFKHRRLTRQECVQLVNDWLEEEWAVLPEGFSSPVTIDDTYGFDWPQDQKKSWWRLCQGR